ncbi:MAG: hypothetical protein NZ953_01850 [Thaumarchaeota archaeon]|nr:hypothetical protein [Candidatus Calditenuaceae archaeon]MDW8043250.1 hypothetical protein [Nitrososphaerota archaeon]
MSLELLRSRLDELTSGFPELEELCDRCLSSRRWGGSAVLMVVDAAFTSIGLSYFRSVVPAVARIKRELVDRGVLTSLEELAEVDVDSVRAFWRNGRSWEVARGVAAKLVELEGDDVSRLRRWASSATLEGWREDPVGSLRGVGLVTYQYLRMMGGIDTSMPDRIVKRVINGLLSECGFGPVEDDVEFVRTVERVSRATGYRAVELTWLTWLLHETELMRRPTYREVVHMI